MASFSSVGWVELAQHSIGSLAEDFVSEVQNTGQPIQLVLFNQ